MYAKITENGPIFPYTLAMLRQDDPEGDYPDDFDLAEAEGVVAVVDGEQPEPGEGQTLDWRGPEMVGDQWTRVWFLHDWLEIDPAELYARIDGDKVRFPYTLADLRRDFPGMSARAGSIKQMDGEWGVVAVEWLDPPIVSPEQIAENLPDADGVEEFAPGRYRQKWTVRDRTAEELEQAKADKLDALRDLRWQKSVGGTTFNGIAIRTDDASQAKIDGLIALFEKAPQLETSDFEAQPNVWVSFDQATAEAVGVAVGLHVQACFSNQRALAAQIDAAATFAALDSIDIEIGWPS